MTDLAGGIDDACHTLQLGDWHTGQPPLDYGRQYFSTGHVTGYWLDARQLCERLRSSATRRLQAHDLTLDPSGPADQVRSHSSGPTRHPSPSPSMVANRHTPERARFIPESTKESS